MPHRTLTARTWRRAVIVSAAVALILVAVIIAFGGDLDPTAPLGGTVEWLAALVRYRDQPWTTLTLVIEEMGAGAALGVVGAAVAAGAAVLASARRRAVVPGA